MNKPNWKTTPTKGEVTELWAVKRQHTAGAYKTMKLFYSHDDALDYLKTIVDSYDGDYDWDGGDAFDAGTSVHNVTRYRIAKQPIG